MNRPRRSLSFAVASVLLLLASARTQCGLETTTGDPLAYLQGNVTSLATWDPDGVGPLPQLLVAAGTFDVAYGQGQRLVIWNGTDWTNLNAPAATSIYPGSPPLLTTWNGKLIVHLAGDIWSFDGSVWTLLGSPRGIFLVPGTVTSMIVYNGELVVAGNFLMVESPGQPLVYADNVAKWNGSTWSALGGGLTEPPGALRATGLCAAVFNNSLWIGVKYDWWPTQPSTGGIQVWNGSAWTPVGVWDGLVTTLATRIGTALTNSFLFAGGTFTSVSGTASPDVVRFNPSTNSWSAIGAPPTAAPTTGCQQLFVRSIGISSYELVGSFTTDTADKAWTWTGSAWAPLPVFSDDAGAVTSARIHYHGGRYVAGLQSSNVGGPRRGLRAHDSAAAKWTPLFGTGLAGVVRAVCHDGEDLVVGGDFATISGTVTNRIARGIAGHWQPLGSGFANGTVLAVVRLPNGDLVAGGDFTTLGDGSAANRIARWNGAAWGPLGSGLDGTVNTLLVLPNGDVVAGGTFTNAGGQPASRVARWNGGSWSPLGAGCFGTVNALLRLTNGDLVAGGHFLSAGGQPCNRIARWDGASWSPIGAGVDGNVYALTESNDGIVVGGEFQMSGVYPTPYLARWDGTGVTWYPFGTFDQPDRPVRALATLPGGETVIGGPEFTLAGGPPTCVAVRRGADWQELDVRGARVWSLAAGPASLAVGGDFVRVGATVAANVATIVSTCPALATNAAPGCPSSGGANTLATVTLPWANGTWRTRATGLPANALVLVLTSVTPVVPGVPLSLLFEEGVPVCNLHVVPDILQVAVAAGGTAQSQFFLPDSPPIVGVPFFQQMVPIEFDPANGAWLAITATNALHLTGGFF